MVAVAENVAEEQFRAVTVALLLELLLSLLSFLQAIKPAIVSNTDEINNTNFPFIMVGLVKKKCDFKKNSNHYLEYKKGVVFNESSCHVVNDIKFGVK